MPNFIVPPDNRINGSTGHLLDHTQIADDLTQLKSSNAFLSSYTSPAAATAETIPRYSAVGAASAMVSGTLYLQAIGLTTGVVVNNITMCTKGTGAATVTHGWYVLLDNTLKVQAVTADQTGGSPWGTVNTPYTFATNAYTTTYDGLYYVGLMVAATTPPIMLGANSTVPVALINVAPVMGGSSSAGQTTPPATGATMAAITGAAGYCFYAYTS